MNQKTLNGIYDFMAKAYQGNWQYRFGDTPFMTAMDSSGKHESILAHQWALMEFWFVLRRLCPNLDKAVDTVKLYEMLMNHDLGETVGGDVSQTKQLAGEGSDKVSIEHLAMINLTSSLPKAISDEIVKLFELYEAEIDQAKSIEQLVARFIDYIQGNQFALTFGNDLPENSELISKIVENWWARYAQKLIGALGDEGLMEASKEVKEIANAHIEIIAKTGIKLNIKSF
jgi:5'-deoxynucleotidase YfbR-like HD superfamily hydrolase